MWHALLGMGKLIGSTAPAVAVPNATSIHWQSAEDAMDYASSGRMHYLREGMMQYSRSGRMHYLREGAMHYKAKKQ